MKSNIDNFKLDWMQGPQILKIETGYRLYFSTRIQEEKFYYSEVRYVEFDHEFKKRTSELSNPVLQKSGLGHFDEHGIFPLNPFYYRDIEGNLKVAAFTCGWKRKKSVPIDMSIGKVFSEDGGKTFNRKNEGPIISGNYLEPCLLGDPFLFSNSNSHTLFYIYGTGWVQDSDGRLERSYRIAKADSKDLTSWNRSGEHIIPTRIKDEAQAMPTVLKHEGILHMFYCYRGIFDFRSNTKNSYKIGHAYCIDGKNWFLSNLSIPRGKDKWDSHMQCYPHAIIYSGKVMLFYNGNNFGKEGIGLFEMSLDELGKYARL